ncbi:MAG: DUF5723 family protein, partial [Flavitalea sp.]
QIQLLIEPKTMKNFLLVILSFVIINSISAQDFPGYRSGSYTGVNGVFFNPATMAGSPYKFDVNLFSLSTLVANNQASFKLSNIGQSFNGDSIKNQIFGKNAGPASGSFTTDIHGPSVMVSVGKNSFAFTTRARAFGTVKNIDGKLFNELSNSDFINDGSLPYTISSNQNMRLAVNAWSEFGLSYAREFTEGPHTLKAGISLKYLSGAGNGYVDINTFNTTLNSDIIVRDAYLANTTGQISTGFGGVNISNFDGNDLTKMKSHGFGTDIGFVYEFRTDVSSAKKYTPYKFKFGASILDIGSIKYKKDTERSGAYNMHITGNQRLYLNDFQNVNIDDYNSFFAARPQYFTALPANASTTYKVSLPTTLQLDADYHIENGFFVSMGGQFSLSNKTKAYNNVTYSSITIAPRFEKRAFGVYLPINYNQLSKLNAGISLRFGPVFIGSGSVISALVGESKQVDFHFGVRFGMMK